MANTVRKTAKKAAKETKKDAKQTAANKRQGKRYVKAGARKAKAANRSSVRAQRTGKDSKQYRAEARAETSSNLTKAGKEALKKGTKPASRKKLKVTKKSRHQKDTAHDPYYTGKRRDYKGSKKRKR